MILRHRCRDNYGSYTVDVARIVAGKNGGTQGCNVGGT
jgi:hypothetical protein